MEWGISARVTIISNDSRSALIIRLGQIDDVIKIIPGARALHEEGFTIYWVCGDAAKPLLESYVWINVVHANEEQILGAPLLTRAMCAFALWSKLLKRRYTLCATLYFERRFRLLTLPIRAERKLVLSEESRATTFIEGRHETDEYLRILLGGDDQCMRQSASPIHPERLPPSPLPPVRSSMRVAIAPGTLTKDRGQQIRPGWPIEKYVAVAKQLLERKWEIVLIAELEDSWVRSHFKTLPVITCARHYTLPEEISAYDSCDAVITDDAGPLHLAGLSRACVIGIVGSMDPSTQIPRRSGVSGVWSGECSCCSPYYHEVRCASCQPHGGMSQVKPELVISELDRLLRLHFEGSLASWRIISPYDS